VFGQLKALVGFYQIQLVGASNRADGRPKKKPIKQLNKMPEK